MDVAHSIFLPSQSQSDNLPQALLLFTNIRRRQEKSRVKIEKRREEKRREEKRRIVKKGRNQERTEGDPKARCIGWLFAASIALLSMFLEFAH